MTIIYDCGMLNADGEDERDYLSITMDIIYKKSLCYDD